MSLIRHMTDEHLRKLIREEIAKHPQLTIEEIAKTFHEMHGIAHAQTKAPRRSSWWKFWGKS